MTDEAIRALEQVRRATEQALTEWETTVREGIAALARLVESHPSLPQLMIDLAALSESTRELRAVIDAAFDREAQWLEGSATQGAGSAPTAGDRLPRGTPGTAAGEVVAEAEDERRSAMRAKIVQAWGSSVGEKGYGAPDEVAERLFDALYQPGHVVAGIHERADPEFPADLREKTQKALEAPVDVGAAPDREEFVRVVSDTIVRDVPVTAIDEARDELAQLADRGVTVMIWSAGEPKHQHHKLAAIGIVDPSIAPSIEPAVVVSHAFGEPLEIATAIAPAKTTAENMARVAEIAGERQLVVVDDRTKNLMEFQKAFPEATAIWVRFGTHAEKSMAKIRNGEDPRAKAAIDEGRIVPIADVAELTATIADLQERGKLPPDEQLAVASDLDDTMIDNDRRRIDQEKLLEELLESRGWLAPPAATTTS